MVAQFVKQQREHVAPHAFAGCIPMSEVSGRELIIPVNTTRIEAIEARGIPQGLSKLRNKG